MSAADRQGLAEQSFGLKESVLASQVRGAAAAESDQLRMIDPEGAAGQGQGLAIERIGGGMISG